MTKFRVTEVVSFLVEAEDEEDAMMIIIDDANRDEDFFEEVVDRYVEEVEP